MLQKIKRLLGRSQYPKEVAHTKEFAFTAGGIDYFRFADFNNIPPLRGMKTLVFFEEMRMKCTLEYLTLHVQAIDRQLEGSKVNIFEIKKLNDQLKQRLELAIDMEGVYKVASIVFFDANEDVRDYDFGYNAKKIENWKKHYADAFFLLTPIKELVPALQNTDENFRKYIQVVKAMNEIHLENLLRNVPPPKTERSKSNLSSSAAKILPS